MKKDDPYFYEEEFLKDSKESRKLRKLKRKQDRSKFKKTDIAKQKEQIIKNDDLNKARVLSIAGEEILIESDEKEYICKLKGILKKEKTLNKNIIAVGDFVNFSKDDKTIYSIDKRFSILSRKHEQKQTQQIIAVNIDQVLITTSVVMPTLKPHLIDRYIIASIKGNMTPIIIINKIDLLGESIDEKYQLFLEGYEKLGITILSISAKKKIGLDSLFNLMKNKASVFSGQSGVGKSSLINVILQKKLKTHEVIKKTLKGAHATTKSELIPLQDGGFCIDTPGIKGFGIWDLTKEDIINHFSEIKKYGENCKYPNCFHLEEPDCNVKKAYEENKISSLRFDSYRSLIKEALEQKHYR